MFNVINRPRLCLAARPGPSKVEVSRHELLPYTSLYHYGLGVKIN